LPQFHIPFAGSFFAGSRTSPLVCSNSLIRLAGAALVLAATCLAQSVSVSAPANNATVSSPVQIAASANGGGYPVVALRIYVDNQAVYQADGSSASTQVALPAGSHHIVPVAWNSLGQVAVASAYINVTTNVGITVAAPTAGANVSAPVQFAASATAPSGRVITAMRVYVDNTAAYTVNAASLNTSLSASSGSHQITTLAWDETGAVYSNQMNINVNASSSNPSYQNNFSQTSQYTTQFSQADGALLYTPQEIDPYFANIGAIGMTRDPNRMPQVVAWMNWYVNHLNWPDQWGLYGTTYNYNVVDGTEISTGDADSTDSYAGTFLTLAWDAWQTGNPQAQALISGLSYQLDVIGGVIIQTQQSDGLTWAKPNYQIKYLMDNAEAYRGLRDLASLYQAAFGDSAKAAYYNSAADAMQNGIYGMWMNGTWAVYKNDLGALIAPNLGTWYADATAQLFPVVEGVVTSGDPRAQQSYAAFNAAWPNWPTLSFNAQDPFPWCVVGDAAAAMGDNGRLSTYISTIQNRYVNNAFPWPFYIAEAGWFLRQNNYMTGGPF
jgi:hypothetical protein